MATPAMPASMMRAGSSMSRDAAGDVQGSEGHDFVRILPGHVQNGIVGDRGRVIGHLTADDGLRYFFQKRSISFWRAASLQTGLKMPRF